jgi:LPS-assembly protein
MKYSRVAISVVLVPLLLVLSSFRPLHGARAIDFKSISNPIDISANRLEHDKEAGTYTGKGNVEVREGLRVLTADYVFFDDTTKNVLAEGNVVFQDEEDVVECQKLSLNLITKRGTIEKGKIFIRKGNFRITGESIEKKGESTYKIKEGGLTTCEGDKPDWRFTAKDVDVTLEGFAKTKGAMFQINNHSVFYLPYGVFPVKTERQSGFLLPEIQTSTRDGAVFKNSYFWVISKDKDATIYMDYIENRGFKPGMEFRYALTEDTKGTWYGSIINDQDYDGTRWQIKGKHEQKLFTDMSFKMNVNHVSDIYYLQDFNRAFSWAERAENQLKSTAFIEKPFKKSLLTAEMSNFQSLATRNNDDTFQYYPFLSYFTEYIPLLKGKVFTDFQADYNYFYRDAGDKVSRLNLMPSVRVPYSAKGVNMLFSGTAVGTGYAVKGGESEGIDDGTQTRKTFKVAGDANMQFIRNYNTTLFDIGEMQSLIMPRLQYNFIPNSSFTNLPFVDPSDRIYQTNTITYSLNHYLNSVSGDKVRELALFEIQQSYGLSETLGPSDLYRGSGGRFSDIYGRTTFFPKDKLNYTNEVTINTSGSGLTGMKNYLRYAASALTYGQITHSYTQDLENQVYLDVAAQYWRFEGRYQIRYSFQDTAWVDTLYQLSYRPGCWAVTLRLNQTRVPSDTRIGISFDFVGITSSR